MYAVVMICNYVMVTLRYEGKALVHNYRISERRATFDGHNLYSGIHEVLLVAYNFTQKKNNMISKNVEV